jgi:restriction system protein
LLALLITRYTFPTTPNPEGTLAIPDFQSCMLPLLELCADGKEKTLKEAVEGVASFFNLSDSEIHTLLPSGKQPVFHNRLNWAKTYMQKAGLIESVRRGVFKITKRGLETLASAPDRIDINYMMRFKEFEQFKAIKKTDFDESDTASAHIDPDSKSKTPDEQIADGYKFLRNELSSGLLEKVKTGSWQFFEQLVIDLLLAMGYGESRESSAKALGRSGDEGVDGVINEDKLGLDVIYIQAKKWTDGSIGRPEIQKFVGALQGKRAKKGVFITTSKFTKDALDYVTGIDARVILIDGDRLANLMIDHNIGVAVRETYEIKRLDSDYFFED